MGMSRMIRARILQISRQNIFKLALIIILFLAVIVTPRQGGAIAFLSLDPSKYIQANNATWISTNAAIILSFLIPLSGLILLRNFTALDEASNLNALMISSGTSKIRYIFSRYFVNLFTLISLWLIGLLGTVGMIWLRFPSEPFPTTQLLSVFSVLLPPLVMASALILLLDTIPLLRGTFGTILGVLVFLVNYVVGLAAGNSGLIRIFNLSNVSFLQDVVNSESIRVSGHKMTNFMILGQGTKQYNGTKSLIFSSVQFKANDWLTVFYQIFAAIIIILILGLFVLRNEKSTAAVRRQPLFQIKSRAIKVRSVNYPAFLDLPMSLIPRFIKSFSKLQSVVILIIWGCMWLANSDVTNTVLLPVLMLITLPYRALIGTFEQSTGLREWIGSINAGPIKMYLGEKAIGLACILIILLPSAIKVPHLSLFFIVFGVASVSVAQLLGSFTEKSNIFTVLSVLFWFIYLNGVTIFLPIRSSAGFMSQMIVYIMLIALVEIIMVWRRNRSCQKR